MVIYAFLKSENFKSRVLTAVTLVIVCVLSLFTPNIILFRVFFGAAGIMAALELHLAAKDRMKKGLLANDTAVYAEIIVILVGLGTVAFALESVEIILVLIVSIANDTIAYLTSNFLHGKFFKSRPFPVTSPKKSWEGIIGGYIGAALFCFAFLTVYKYINGFRDLSAIPFSYLELLFIFIAPIIAILGDYIESCVKRCIGLKDSDEIIRQKEIPVLSNLEDLMKGHGGFADRIDSCVLVACYALCLKVMPPT